SKPVEHQQQHVLYAAKSIPSDLQSVAGSMARACVHAKPCKGFSSLAAAEISVICGKDMGDALCLSSRPEGTISGGR
ncbi:MAG: hypothetical protein RLN72_09905, partial [Henriciella sp.]